MDDHATPPSSRPPSNRPPSNSSASSSAATPGDAAPGRYTLDDLADLFLTTPGRSAPTPADAVEPDPAAAADASTTSQSTAAPDASATDAGVLEGPAPIKLRPKAAGSATPSPDGTDASPAASPDATDGDAVSGDWPASSLAAAEDLHELAQWVQDNLESAQGPRPAAGDTPAGHADPAAGPPLRLAGDDTPDPVQDVLSAHPPAPPASPVPATPASTPLRPEGGPARATAEAVLLGNLPGMAGPWLTQYGQRLAQQDGPVLILHLAEDQVDLELVEPTSRPSAEADGAAGPDRIRRPQAAAGRALGPGLRIPPGGFRGRDLVEVLDYLCRTRHAPVRTLLVHIDAAPESLPQLLTFNYWTLLTGADDAAIVAGYRLLKRLLEAEDRVARAHVGLMVVGHDASAGQNTASKLRAAVGESFHAPLDLLGYQQRMTPARCRTLGSFACGGEVWARLGAWLEALLPPDAAADEVLAPAVSAEQSVAMPAETGEAESPIRRGGPMPFRPAAGSKLPPLDQPVRVAPPPFKAARPAANGEAASSSSRAAADPPPAAAAAAFRAQSDALSDLDDPAVSLFDLIDTDPRTTASIPGGLPLEARCPRQPETQLAVDAAGRLHLLHRHDSASGDMPTPREAIVNLVAVRDWARQHLALLQLTERTRHFDLDVDPVLHLFTDRADQAVSLVAQLGDLVKLHLLREVSVGEHQTLFCTPLSA